MAIFLVILLIGILFLSIILKNIYFFSVVVGAFSICIIYILVNTIVYRKKSKNKVSSKVDLYCKGQEGIGMCWIYFPILISIGNDLNFNYILENFSEVSFKEQYLFIFIINGVIWALCFLIMFIYEKIDSKKGIVYREGLILSDGKLYSFDKVKNYKFNTSFKGMKYRDLVLTYDDKNIKTVCIYNEDIDKFKALLDKNKVV
ncbi:hypothetical protein [Clostridium sp. CCUG 7971]|uniref:hypothetical protein n=1 Tax=Clostridium sp. CCUG 7971 TaxID=2811414 RepID=UPI001ABAE3A2|nr:hypothetical protein [Clostridium sp. CCUG 7971]MBO3443912.1 hypothetical protein [Clostridium sp. CCUG 7971]